MAFGFQHDLSKRTALYATYSRINNDGTTATGSLFQLGNGAAGMLRGQTATGYEFGVRHNF